MAYQYCRALQVALVVKNLPANAEDIKDSGSIPGSGQSSGKGIGYPLQYSWASLESQPVKNLPAMWKLASIPGLGRSPGGGHGNPLQYSYLENSMDRGARQTAVPGVSKGPTGLRD